MSKRSFTFVTLGFLAALMAMPSAAQAQLDKTAAWVAHVSNEYRVVPNVVYLTANNHENKLDLYLPTNASSQTPVLMYMHGGGWVRGNKESNVLRLLPYLQMGWAVVNVQYRLGPVSLAPAAVEDCLCALRWVIRNADEHNFDTSRIVLTGHSAGGHLTLTTGMIPASAGLDRQCPGTEKLQVAAMINWYGITDVGDLLEGPNMKSYAVEWMGSLLNRIDIAHILSPMTYVRKELPPIFTIHGDADPSVPYQHAVRFHAALDQAGVSNEFHTVSGGGHGRFSLEETAEIFKKLHRFLRQHGLTGQPSSSQEQP